MDGLRGAAALYVMLHHMWLEIWPVGRFPTGRIMTATGWLLWGHFAVSVFIVISGYCLTLPVVARGRSGFSFGNFFKHRARRILPPYYFGMLLTGVLILTCIGRKTGTHWDMVLPATFGSVARGLLLVPEFGGTINHTYWSVGVECKIYLLFPLVLWSHRRLGVLRSTAAFTAATLVLAYFERDWALSVYLALFCMGGAAAYIVNSEAPFWDKIRRWRAWAVVWIAGWAITAVLLHASGYKEWRFCMIDPMVGAAAVATLAIAGRTGPAWNPLRVVLSWRPLVLAGAFSYSLYLIHGPLIQVVWQYLIARWFATPVERFTALVIIGSPLIVLASWIFYRFCERPFASH